MEKPLFPDDIVQRKTHPQHIGVVDRTHADVESHEPNPQRHEPEPIIKDSDVSQRAFSQFLRDGVPPKGDVLVRWQHTTSMHLVPESKLRLLDRSLLIGDVVKRGPNHSTSGVVVNTLTRCTLQPICDLTLTNHRELKGLLPQTAIEADIREIRNGRPPHLIDIPAHELKYVESPSEADLVIYGDWIGRVETVRTALVVKLTDGCVVEISDEQAEHVDGAIDAFYIGDVASTKKGRLRTGRWIYGQYNPNTPPLGTVVDARVLTAEVTWLQKRIGSTVQNEPPQVLERDELESSQFHVYDRTRRPPGHSSGSYQNISNSEIDVRLGLRVRFKDVVGASVKYDGSSTHGKFTRIERRETTGYDLNVFDVVHFFTDVTVQWQDTTVTSERSVDLVPEHAFDDEHAAWPGEIVHATDLSPVADSIGMIQPSRVGVVQSVDSQGRMAKLRWCENSSIQYANDSGTRSLVTGVVGIAVGEMEEISLYDVEAPAEMNVRRGDLVLIASQSWKLADLIGTNRERDWIGEIVDTRLDGTLVVRLGAASQVQDVRLRREEVVVAVRSDGTDGVGDQWANEEAMNDLLDEQGAPYMDEDGQILMSGHNLFGAGDSNSEFDDGSDYDDFDEAEATYEDENGVKLDEQDLEDWESDDGEDIDGDEEMVDAPQQTPPTSLDATPPATIKRGGDSQITADETSAAEPEQYLILDTPVPSSHQYLTQPATESPAHTKRTAKEHKILRSPGALPPGVYVRTWDSRLDLLRVLFIGPSDTPYANAPFIIDFYLPADFPTSPPHAFFHSWTAESGLGGVGRVNPNLYEDGKICLSLLGTWDGSRSEGWNAGKSTLLQVIVSVLGLVLVREPYFNEAGYEPLAGLESSKRPSAVYNERVYLRSKTFLLSAMRGVAGVEGLEDVLQWQYRRDGGPGLLGKMVRELQEVLERSEASAQETDGLTVMSKGACIPLRRVLERLEEV